MLHRVFLPQLGQTMEEGTIEKWHKQEGDPVKKGEVLFELTTDKATLEVEALADGFVRRVLASEGQTYPVNMLIAVIGAEDDEVTEEFLAEEGAEAPAAAEEAVESGTVQEAVAVAEPAPGAAPAAPSAVSFASPRARKIAKEQRVPLGALRGSGPGGRIIERDVTDYLAKLDGVRYTPAARVSAYEAGVSLVEVGATAPGQRITVADVEAAARSRAARPAAVVPGERITFTAMRHTIAERMTASKQTVPHFYLVGDVMMRAGMDRVREISAASGRKVTVTALLIKAVGVALKRHPRVNARFDGDAVVLNSACNVGVAVAVEDGLFVPVVRGADGKDLPTIGEELRKLAGLAREGRLVPEQYEGGSITLSNLGMYGVDYFLPIINPPESCIVGVGIIKEEAVVVDGGIRIEPVMKVSVSADHRVTDGAEAAEFFRTMKGLLENPDELTA